MARRPRRPPPCTAAAATRVPDLPVPPASCPPTTAPTTRAMAPAGYTNPLPEAAQHVAGGAELAHPAPADGVRREPGGRPGQESHPPPLDPDQRVGEEGGPRQPQDPPPERRHAGRQQEPGGEPSKGNDRPAH